MKFSLSGTLLWLFVIHSSFSTYSQDKAYAKNIIDKLAAPAMQGRGYVKKGDQKAARFISKEFARLGLHDPANNYMQYFSLSINTFPGKLSLAVDGNPVQPGSEFVIASSSPSVNDRFELAWLEGDTIPAKIDTTLYKGKFVVCKGDIKKLSLENPFRSAGIVIPIKGEDNLWWHVSSGKHVRGHTLLVIREDKVPRSAKTINLKVRNKFMPHYVTQNVVGYIPGTSQPESYLVITAHYDHLGKMGRKVYFPGANDNASGVAMMMDMARHYKLPENRLPVSILFIACAGEETGLLGSSYFTENPLIPLNNIRFLINLDMVGTGSEGISVVNGDIYEMAVKLLHEINDRESYVTKVFSGGESCNSDHCPFYQKGVNSIFIFTRGPEHREYHNVKDRADSIPLTAYEGVFRLLTRFGNEITK